MLSHRNQQKAAYVLQNAFTKALHGTCLKTWVKFCLLPSKNEVQGSFMCGTGFYAARIWVYCSRSGKEEELEEQRDKEWTTMNLKAGNTLTS